MISKKDNLLTRPWQQRKFEYHRRKVLSALPAIDTTPPAYRGHVAMKLKKQQKESERCKKIERDNYLLLQKMDHITRTSRIDNAWKIPQPNFLNKIAIYNPVVPKIEDIDLFESEEIVDEPRKSRKASCYACSPQKREEINVCGNKPRQHTSSNERPSHAIGHPDQLRMYNGRCVLSEKFPNLIFFNYIPEDRIPWEPTKRPVRRVRSKSVPVQRSSPLPTIIEQQQVSYGKPSSSKVSQRAKTSIPKTLKSSHKTVKEISAKEPQSIILSRGCLKLSVNFPSDTLVKFQEGNMEKILMNGLCHCKNSPAIVF